MSKEATNSMEQFFTRERANEGIKLPLHTPDGKKSDHWLMIRGVDSDAFQDCQRAQMRAQAIIQADLRLVDDEEERARLAAEKWEEQETRLVASLVAGWSFDQECNEENIMKFLRNAPQIKAAINSVSAKRSLFFMSGGNNSNDMQE